MCHMSHIPTRGSTIRFPYFHRGPLIPSGAPISTGGGATNFHWWGSGGHGVPRYPIGLGYLDTAPNGRLVGMHTMAYNESERIPLHTESLYRLAQIPHNWMQRDTMAYNESSLRDSVPPIARAEHGATHGAKIRSPP